MGAPATARAQKKKPAAGAKKAAAGKAKPDELGVKIPEPETLPDVDFDAPGAAPAANAPIVQDKDETADGRQRLREIEARARVIFRERDQVMDKRRPLAIQRDVMFGQARQAYATYVEAYQTYAALDGEAAAIKQQLQIAPPITARDLKAQLAVIQANGAALKVVMANQTAVVNKLKPPIDALNVEIAPFDARLQKLWQELTEARKQWLELREPMQKYARGEFEALRRVLDEWLLIDGLWPSAFAWAALCSHELREPDKAGDYLEKAQNLPDEIRSKGVAAQLSALTGLVTGKLPGQSEKARKSIAMAQRDVDKKTGWETFFLIGRFYADRERELLRSKAAFETALKIKPNCLCAKLWLARLQTTAADEKIRDLKTGIKTLEYLWESTGKRSWRLAFFLFEALHRAGRSADANQMWEKAMQLAPAERHEQLQLDRRMIMETT